MTQELIRRAMALVGRVPDPTAIARDMMEARAKGGGVKRSPRLLQDQYPTSYMPNVGRQIMAEGGVPQRIADVIQRGQPLQPNDPTTTPESFWLSPLQEAKADTRVGADIVGKRLNTIVPESERVAGGQYTPGAPDGGRWADMDPKVLDQPGVGFNVKDEELRRLWDESVQHSSEAAKRAVAEHKVSPKFLAKDWDKAMKLPLRDHLWYELSGEKMAENMPDLEPHEFMHMMDLIGATSARAKPGENLERSLATLSQHLRGAGAQGQRVLGAAGQQNRILQRHALSDRRRSDALPHFSQRRVGGQDVWCARRCHVFKPIFARANGRLLQQDPRPIQ